MASATPFLDDVRSQFAVRTFETVSHRRYAPWPRILHFDENSLL